MNKIHDEFEVWLEGVPTTEEVLSSAETVPLADYRRAPSFVADLLKGMVTQAVLEAMAEEGATRSDLAAALGRSKQYVGRVLNESANFTLDSLARIACALDREIKVVLHRADEKVVVAPLVDECFLDSFETVATASGDSRVTAGSSQSVCSGSEPWGNAFAADDAGYEADWDRKPGKHGGSDSARFPVAA